MDEWDPGPAARIALITDADDRLARSLDGSGPELMRSPSLLPGWSVGHVLTHLARNADAQCNLLHWALTGERRPMYPSREARDADIEAGAGRDGSEIIRDMHRSAKRLAGVIVGQPADAWHASVETMGGGPVRADVVLSQRLAEVELHHHDLGVDAGLALLSEDAGRALLAAVLHSYGRTHRVPGLALQADGADPVSLGGDGASATAPIVVRGPAASLAGWLAGRSTGADLVSSAPLPALAPW